MWGDIAGLPLVGPCLREERREGMCGVLPALRASHQLVRDMELRLYVTGAEERSLQAQSTKTPGGRRAPDHRHIHGKEEGEGSGLRNQKGKREKEGCQTHSRIKV